MATMHRSVRRAAVAFCVLIVACGADGDPPPLEPVVVEPPNVAGMWEQTNTGCYGYAEPSCFPNDFTLVQDGETIVGCGTASYDGGATVVAPATVAGTVRADSSVTLEIRWPEIDYDWVVTVDGSVLVNLMSGISNASIVEPADTFFGWSDQPVSYQRTSTTPGACP